jgi:hypothetical protein
MITGYASKEPVGDSILARDAASQKPRRRLRHYRGIFPSVVAYGRRLLARISREASTARALAITTRIFIHRRADRYDLAVVAKSRSDYWDALDAAIDQDREAHDKPPLKPKPRETVAKETKVSRTDPQSGYMLRDGKPKGFFFSFTSDNRSGFSHNPDSRCPLQMVTGNASNGTAGTRRLADNLCLQPTSEVEHERRSGSLSSLPPRSRDCIRKVHGLRRSAIVKLP